MSAPAATHDAHAHHDEPSKFHLYIQIAMILAVITGVEVVLVYLPLAKWLVVTALVTLSAVKFLFVIFYFMHLRWDKLFCTILFFIGLVLGGFTLFALLHLFGAEASKPLSAASIEAPAAITANA
ncbi:cytochrome C oxidase subunit IV family protein [Oleiharenicola lentus]|uniref:cytochrome C oxidase subunit IV family protein n=1 Tax=Oleiharenicola lentus TaxID=2508720 RepID=UPI003F681530